jgi:hypothetical protein
MHMAPKNSSSTAYSNAHLVSQLKEVSSQLRNVVNPYLDSPSFVSENEIHANYQNTNLRGLWENLLSTYEAKYRELVNVCGLLVVDVLSNCQNIASLSSSEKRSKVAAVFKHSVTEQKRNILSAAAAHDKKKNGDIGKSLAANRSPRKRFTTETNNALQSYFLRSPMPTASERAFIATQLKLTPKQVTYWVSSVL